MWALEIKANKNALPSLQEITDGLLCFLTDKIDMIITGTDIFDRDTLIEEYKQLFEFFLKSTGVKDVTAPLQYANGGDNDLWNPTGKSVCIIMYLVSIQPSFFLELVKATRETEPLKKQL